MVSYLLSDIDTAEVIQRVQVKKMRVLEVVA